MSMEKGTLIVIAKECLPGRAKTRLSPPLTPSGAAELALVSLEQTLVTAGRVEGVKCILYWDGAPPQGFPYDKFEIIPQISGGLDARLAHVFDNVKHGATGRTFLIGMDTPQISFEMLNAVFDDTSDVDAWLGLTLDGGYWGLGLQKPDGALIEGIAMSTDYTGSEQMHRLQEAKLHIRLLPQLQDMDHWSDALDIAKVVPGTSFAEAVWANERNLVRA
jgi:glycosyltransferase A (GT-A) superfamily protein (DUF2064 family)